MSKARVPLWSKPLSFVTVDTDATKGATVGRDLFWPSGKLVTEADLRGITAGTTPATDAVTYWRLIQEVPPNVSALASATGSGIYVLRGPGVSATRTIESDTLDVENGDGVVGNPSIDLLVRRPAVGAVSALRVVYESPAGVAHLDPTDDDQIAAMLGISITGGIGEIKVRGSGTIDDAGWSWTRGLVFAGADGTLTQTPPTAGWEVVIGYAPSATRLNLTFDEPVKLA